MLFQKKIQNLSRENCSSYGSQRLRPIILTTATTVIGLLPLASGIGVIFIKEILRLAEEFLSGGNLCLCCRSGLTFASAITLFLTPCWLMLPVALEILLITLEKHS